MRLALQRITDPLFGWIPDVSRVPLPRLIALGAILSLLVHLVIFAIATLVRWHDQRVFHTPSDKARAGLVVQIVTPPPPAVQAAEPPKPERDLLIAGGLAAGEKPKDARFQADKDMTAASKLPATGESDLPTETGRSRAPDRRRDFAEADITVQASTEAPPTPDTTVQENQQVATSAPMFKTQPLTQHDLDRAAKAKPDEALPQPATPTREQPPKEKVAKPNEQQLAFNDAPRRDIPEPRAPQPMERPQPAYAMPTPRPLPQSNVGKKFNMRQEWEMERTRNQGIITRRGESAVDAMRTPTGDWETKVHGALQRNFTLFMRQGVDMLRSESGEIVVRYELAPTGGKPLRVQLISSPPGASSFAVSAAVRTIQETAFPRPPTEMLEGLEGTTLPRTQYFNLDPAR